MAGRRVDPAARHEKLPAIEFRRVDSAQTLDDFRALGSTCFHVPISSVLRSVRRRHKRRSPAFICWVGYHDGQPVATAATVSAHGVTGLYNVATIPEYRHRGCGEAITRHAIDSAVREADSTRVVLQSTSEGMRLYRRLGFEPVTRVLVYNSVP